MTQRATFGCAATVPMFLALACADPLPAGPGGGSGGSGSGGVTTGSGGVTGSGGQASGSGGVTGSGGTISASGGSDGGMQEAAAEVPPVTGLPDPGKDGDGRFMMNQPAMPPEAMARMTGVMAGTTKTLQAPAAGGFAARSFQVYTPAGYDGTKPIAFTVFHDGGQGMNQLRGPIIMDNLAFQKKMPKMVGIFIPPVARSREYDTVNINFSQYITDTVLPLVEASGIKLTKDPEATGTCGHSSGGILAFTMAWFQPERYRRVLSLSGSYTHLQTPGGDLYNMLVRTTMPLKPIRIAQIAGTNDLAAPVWTQANETMSASLLAAGYHNRFFMINGGTHNPGDDLSSLTDLLTWLWRNYPASGPTM